MCDINLTLYKLLGTVQYVNMRYMNYRELCNITIYYVSINYMNYGKYCDVTKDTLITRKLIVIRCLAQFVRTTMSTGVR